MGVGSGNEVEEEGVGGGADDEDGAGMEVDDDGVDEG